MATSQRLSRGFHGTVGQPWTIPWDAFVKGQNPFNDLIPLDNREVSLQKLGCSDWEYDTAKFGEIRDVSPTLNRLRVFAPPLMQGLAITLAITFVVYGIIRAIGWVIGGFAATRDVVAASGGVKCSRAVGSGSG